MKKYTNTTPQALSFSIRTNGVISDHVIGPGETVELPSENIYVRSLEAQGHIKEVKTVKEK